LTQYNLCGNKETESVQKFAICRKNKYWNILKIEFLVRE